MRPTGNGHMRGSSTASNGMMPGQRRKPVTEGSVSESVQEDGEMTGGGKGEGSETGDDDNEDGSERGRELTAAEAKEKARGSYRCGKVS